ncbi:MAG: aggregation factor core protein MAFp3, isoform C [Pseudomonadota bacterium]
MTSAIIRCTLCLQALVVTPAIADIRVSYVDSAPDRITIENRSGCALGPFELTIDLGRSEAGLIFDTSGAGAGYSGYAPLQIVSGGEQVLGVSTVTDGDSRLLLELDFLDSDSNLTLAVDVDDTSEESAGGRTIVMGSEIAGALAEARLTAGGPAYPGIFGPDGVAIVPLEACIS